jgi:hypothetical protein
VLSTIATVLVVLATSAQASSPRPPPPRRTTVTLAPTRSDVALAELRFRHAPGGALTRRSLRLAVVGQFGRDYLAFAVASSPGPGGARALVLLVNRPSALLDPAQVRLAVSSRLGLGGVLVRKLTDVLARGATAFRAPLCDLSLHGRPLGRGGLRALGARGAALTGLDATAAIAAAYDAGCGLSYPSAFRQAVQGPGFSGCGGGAAQQGALCCPPNAMCAPGPTPSPRPTPMPGPTPAPVPPSPVPPGCQPCDPRPGYACPAIVRPAICPAVAPAPR